tara:strand:+ start:2963 stop:3565 length:603 start_codon:yes stop_codon:yes gene_type:complete
MQTFFPNHQIKKSARMLDDKRLWRQILDSQKILGILLDTAPPYKNPIVLQWAGYENFLLHYCLVMTDEAWDRGMKSFGVKAELMTLAKKYKLHTNNPLPPEWLGKYYIHESHRAYLLLRGEVDAICESIKKHHKVRSINKWLKLKGFKAKAQLDDVDFRSLEDYCNKNKVDRSIKSWYAQWGWIERLGNEALIPKIKEND